MRVEQGVKKYIGHKCNLAYQWTLFFWGGVLHVCISGIGTGGGVVKGWWMSYLRKVTVQKESLF